MARKTVGMAESIDIDGLTPWLTGAGSRRLEGTNISHEDAEGMAYVGVRVEPTVRLGSVGTVLHFRKCVRGKIGHAHSRSDTHCC